MVSIAFAQLTDISSPSDLWNRSLNLNDDPKAIGNLRTVPCHATWQESTTPPTLFSADSDNIDKGELFYTISN